ncbi:MAG: peptidase, partial [Chitinophagaceae bacterium]
MRNILFFIASLICLSAYSQTTLPTPRNILATYANGTRSVDGRPGKNYWQNTASYDLKINFDPATLLLTGVVDIDYINNSPDTLKQVWFKIYPNLYKNTSPRDSPVDPEDLTEGLIFDSVWINGQPRDKAQLAINSTNWTLSR